MYTKANVSSELEQRIESVNNSLVEALQPRHEMMYQRSMRLEPIVEKYRSIIYSLPMREEDKYSLRSGNGEIYLFKDDSRNSRLLLGIAFGYGIAKGAEDYIHPPGQSENPETLKQEALKTQYWSFFGISTYINYSIQKYGKYIGYHGMVEDAKSMFETIKSLEIESNVPKPEVV